MGQIRRELWKLMSYLVKAHPWHGVSIGDRAPEVVNCYIELVPTDTVKYEIDKPTGHLRVDRPQKYSSLCPMPYGFIPQTLCAEKVGQLCCERTNETAIMGDGDPIDVCVLTENQIAHGDVLARAVPIGGIRLIDANQADDKIIAVLVDDGLYGKTRDIEECPGELIERLRHYFLTYKDIPGRERHVKGAEVYGADKARAVIEASRADYREHFGEVEDFLKKVGSNTKNK